MDTSQLRFQEIIKDNILVWVPRQVQGVLWEEGKEEGLDQIHQNNES